MEGFVKALSRLSYVGLCGLFSQLMDLLFGPKYGEKCPSLFPKAQCERHALSTTQR